MKRVILIILITTLSLSSFAQQKALSERKPVDRPTSEGIEHFIDDLTATQKTRIDIITRRSKQNVESYRKQLQSVRDSIRILMDCKEDRSDGLFPLFDREGELQAKISKEYYRAKTSIDAVLTPEQYDVLRSKMKEPAPREPRPDDGMGPHPDGHQKPPKR